MELSFLCLGGDLKEFLNTLGSVYDVLKNQDSLEEYSDIFICTAINDRSLQLEFISDRPVIALLLTGMLKVISEMIYFVDIRIEVSRADQDQKYFSSKTCDGKRCGRHKHGIKCSILRSDCHGSENCSNAEKQPLEEISDSEAIDDETTKHFQINIGNKDFGELGDLYKVEDLVGDPETENYVESDDAVQLSKKNEIKIEF
ncbi:hypothetical protein NQ317_000371 [Molorchus minor]|uniref:Heme NO-binding domain-containing protein n=1 Tax=Molorchus minor TaxID=1323400 RepID=A0ABQ9JMP5_9CUCU|nr:hypothetical protein NQ317_000371 [Molorchus minor]